MSKFLEYLVERVDHDADEYTTVGRVSNLYYARDLAYAVCRLHPGSIVEISHIEVDNSSGVLYKSEIAEYVETVNGCEVAA